MREEIWLHALLCSIPVSSVALCVSHLFFKNSLANFSTNSGSQYGIRWGFRIVMLFSVVATVPMFAACYVAYNNWQDNLAKGITNDKAGKSLEDGDGDEDDVSFTVDQSTAQSSAPGQLESKTVDSSDEAKPAPYVDGRRQGRRAKRRASTFVQTMGNISLHVSRGRTLTSFHDTDLGHHIAESVVSAFTGTSSADEEVSRVSCDCPGLHVPTLLSTAHFSRSCFTIRD